MDTPLYHQVLERLLDADTDPLTVELVDGALRGEQALAAVLAGEHSAEPRARTAAPPPVQPKGASLTGLTVRGFRGIGPELTLDLEPGPGLTLIVGRNGTGKSSLAEALECLLTGENARWSRRKHKAWQAGWRNLHHRGPVLVQGRFTVEGEDQEVRVSRRWDGEELPASTLKVTGAQDLDALGWSAALADFRPFLSYNELGSLLEDGPARLHDALIPLLGLELLEEAIQRLTQVRLQDDRVVRATRAALKPLLPRLADEASAEPRAQSCLDALSGRTWDLATVEQAVLGDEEDADGAPHALAALARLKAPDEEALLGAVDQLQQARQRVLDQGEGQAGRQLARADLLSRAADYWRGDPGEDCPICATTGVLGEDWAARIRAEAAQLREEARALEGARQALAGAQRRLRDLARPMPQALGAEVPGVPTVAVREAWTKWCEAARSDDPATGMLEALGPLGSAVDEVVGAALTERLRRQDRWRPLARDLARWLDDGRQIAERKGRSKQLKRAEDWLSQAREAIRAERFAPVAADVQQVWQRLRTRSSVDLTGVRITGKGTRRRVELDVQVDGEPGVALGVMSQGELHALALSLFLPRVTLDESPFRFLVVDDPVQSMDPARVDGLAELLHQVAATRQVLVLTHDDRLIEAVRRLKLPARVVAVRRRARSVVALQEQLDPIRQHLADASAVAHQVDRLGPQLASGVVPGLCRLALEAAMTRCVRRRRLGRGTPHAEVAAALAGAQGLVALAALALFDDPERGGEVYRSLNNRFGAQATDAFRACNEGAHGGYDGPLHQLIRDTRSLARGLASP